LLTPFLKSPVDRLHLQRRTPLVIRIGPRFPPAGGVLADRNVDDSRVGRAQFERGVWQSS
jgi:hypothetical protein